MLLQRFLVVFVAAGALLICQDHSAFAANAAKPGHEKKVQKELQANKNKLIVSKKGERKVLYAEGADADEKVVSARKNYKVALQMLQKAIEDGHVVQDKNGLYVKKCPNECSCLPVVASAVKQKQ